MNKIAVIGTGSFALAIAHQLTNNKSNHITLFSRDKSQCTEINEQRTNKKYLNNFILSKRIKSTSDYSDLINYNIVILAIPSSAILTLDSYFKNSIAKDTLIINMSKGLIGDGLTVCDYFAKNYCLNNFVCLKGPSFSSELLTNHPTLFTLGYSSYEQLARVQNIIDKTHIYLDYSNNINTIEYLSVLKNIYAIFIGNIDAKFNSHNTRYFILTQCFNEMKSLLKHLNCDVNALSLGCGIGDLSLTSLSDLSRNRTLGLMIGKGFFDISNNSQSVVLEGVKTLHLLANTLDEKIIETLPILNILLKYFINREISDLNIDFSTILKKKYKTVLTYGTFDLFHYGHLEILSRAKNFGNRLIVGLSSDEFNLEKGKVCEFTYEKRKEYLESLGFVDLVIPENSWDQKIIDVKKYNVDYFLMGDDWKNKFDFLEEYCEVVYLPRTKGISSTQMKEILKGAK